MRPIAPFLRFEQFIDVQASGCWFWNGFIRSNGYAAFWTGSRKVYAHRYAFEIFIGPIPIGQDIDHLCRNRRCVNPTHLEPVTRLVNLSRGQHPNMQAFVLQQATGKCRSGHELTELNVSYRASNGREVCRICNRARCRAYYYKRKASLNAIV